MSNIILGIDPGSRNTGIAVLSNESGKWKAIRCETLKVTAKEEHPDRLQYIFETISALIEEVKPTSCAIETPIYGVDPQAMLKLGRAQAAAMLAITNKGLAVSEYYPKVVKKSITGNGNANKEQVAFMLSKVVTMPEGKISKDATDALAVAWCHSMNLTGGPASPKATHQNNKKSDWKAFIDANPDRIRKT